VTGPTAAPTLSTLRLAPRSFAGATTVSYTTSADSTTTLSVLKCRGKRCARLVLQKPSLTHLDKAGKVSFRFKARLGAKALGPGRYVLRARGANAKGAGNTVKATFTIVKRR
jgi:hypothetical protein